MYFYEWKPKYTRHKAAEQTKKENKTTPAAIQYFHYTSQRPSLDQNGGDLYSAYPALPGGSRRWYCKLELLLHTYQGFRSNTLGTRQQNKLRKKTKQLRLQYNTFTTLPNVLL
jgi:hypothetical protein